MATTDTTPKTRVKMKAVFHYETEWWATLGEGGYKDCLSTEQAAATDQANLEADPFVFLHWNLEEDPAGLDVCVLIEDVEVV
jgi:hypothetical protein